MDVFAFREELVAECERFSRNFANIRAEDISREVDSADAAGRFWPAPLIQLNPNFEPGGYIDDLVAAGTLDAECAKVFRLKRGDDTFGEHLLLHRHQTDAIEIARRHESYVLTTGTGSGKSLAYFIPIVNDVLRHKRAGDACKGITAIVVYPMPAFYLAETRHRSFAGPQTRHLLPVFLYVGLRPLQLLLGQVLERDEILLELAPSARHAFQ